LHHLSDVSFKQTAPQTTPTKKRRENDVDVTSLASLHHVNANISAK